MNELQKELENAYQLIGRVTVSGDAVDWIAGARVALRRAFQMAEEWPSPVPRNEERIATPVCALVRNDKDDGEGKDEGAGGASPSPA